MDNEDEMYDLLNKYSNKLIEAQIAKHGRWLNFDEMGTIQAQFSAEAEIKIHTDSEDSYEGEFDGASINRRRRVLTFSFDNVIDCNDIGKSEDYLLDHEILDIFGVMCVHITLNYTAFVILVIL